MAEPFRALRIRDKIEWARSAPDLYFDIVYMAMDGVTEERRMHDQNSHLTWSGAETYARIIARIANLSIREIYPKRRHHYRTFVLIPPRH